MRKKFVLFIITFTFCVFSPTFSQIKVIEESDMQVKKLFENYIEKGINIVNTIRYDIDHELVSEESEKICKVIVDAEKNTFTEITYYPNYSKSVTAFNEQRNVKDISIYYSDNNLMSRVITNYDSDNKVKEKIYYFGNTITFKTNYIYASGNIIKIDYVDSAGKNLSFSKLFYDGSDRLIEEDKYNEEDSLEIIYSYIYDNSGNCTEETVNYPQANYKTRIIYKFDNSGNKKEKTVYSLGDKMVSKSEFKYNDKGLLTEISEFSIEGKLISKNSYRYDDRGNKTEWRYSDYIEDMEYLYSYEYQ